jgi:hypothetical protein
MPPSTSVRPILTESDLQLVWARQIALPTRLMTEDSKPLVVEFPGVPSAAGPDFRSARILLDGVPKIGDVELHLVPSGWPLHRHRGNVEFANVILHVALWREEGSTPPVSFQGRPIPELVLEPFLRESVAQISDRLSRAHPPSGTGRPVARLLDAEGDERLRQKAARVERLCRLHPREQVLYLEFMAAMGFRQNKGPFIELALRLPVGKLAGRPAEPIRCAMEWVAGFGETCPPGFDAPDPMDPLLWRRRGVRPSNRPERRIRTAASILAAVGDDGLEGTFRSLFAGNVTTDPDRIVRFGREIVGRFVKWGHPGLGVDRAGAILHSVLVPYFVATFRREGAFEEAAFARDLWRHCPPAPDTFPTRTMKRLIFGTAATSVVHNVRREQGLLGLYARRFG